MRNYNFLVFGIFLIGILFCSVVSAATPDGWWSLPSGIENVDISVSYHCNGGCNMADPGGAVLSCDNNRFLRITVNPICKQLYTYFLGSYCTDASSPQTAANTMDCGIPEDGNTRYCSSTNEKDIVVTHHAKGCDYQLGTAQCYDRLSEKIVDYCKGSQICTGAGDCVCPPFTLPANTATCTYTAVTTGGCNTSYTTNCQAPAAPAANLPDLIVNNILITNDKGIEEAVPTAGENVLFGVAIKNIGDASTTSAIGVIVRPITSAIGLNPFVGTLNAGSASPVWTSQELIFSFPSAGYYSIVATVDCAGDYTNNCGNGNHGSITESNEMNNEFTKIIYVAPAPTVTAACTDSDGGLEYYTKGNASTSGALLLDQCCTDENDVSCGKASGKILAEAYCENPTTPNNVKFTCLNNCSDGACLPVCTDNDGGENYGVRGTTVGSSIFESGIVTKTDYCEGNELIEYYCNENGVEGVRHLCSECLDGVCVESIPAPPCDGCTLNSGACVGVGTRTGGGFNGTYCTLDGSWQEQKPNDDYCNENYECTSNECREGICVSSYNLIKQIWCNIYAATSITTSIPEIIAGASISEQFWNSVYTCLGKPIGPDFTVTSAALFNDFWINNAGLDFSVRNIGTKGVDALKVSYTVYDESNNIIKSGEETFNNFNPATMRGVWIYFGSPLKPGTYSVLIEADKEGAIDEINEDNNGYSIGITFASYAGLLIEYDFGNYSYQSSASGGTSEEGIEYTVYYAGYKLSGVPDNFYISKVLEFENRTYVENYIDLYLNYYGILAEQDYKGQTVYEVTEIRKDYDSKQIAWTMGNWVIFAGSDNETSETPQADLEALYDAYLGIYPSDSDLI